MRQVWIMLWFDRKQCTVAMAHLYRATRVIAKVGLVPQRGEKAPGALVGSVLRINELGTQAVACLRDRRVALAAHKHACVTKVVLP